MTFRISHMAIAALATFSASSAIAAPIITGNGGTAVANGVVTAPPADGPGFNYISTYNGVAGVGKIVGGPSFTGSTYITDTFVASSGSTLTFYFNFVTSDGAEFSDYAWAALMTPAQTNPSYLFSARTTPTGDTVPGFALPGLAAVLTPGTTPIIPGGPVWDKLGGWSGQCYDAGCGYTGWIKSTYIIPTAGTYRLGFGVANAQDNDFQSGLAFTGAFVDGAPVDKVPEPGTWAMLIAGFGLVGAAARRRRNAAVAA
jgi:hypothetical protein